MTPYIFDNPSLLRLGWALLHFLWQGALIALALKGTLLLINSRHAKLRYALALAALLLMALLPVLLLCKPPAAGTAFVAPHASGFVDTSVSTHAITDIASSSKIPDSPIEFTGFLMTLVPWIPLFWFPGISLRLLKTLGGILQVQRLKQKSALPGHVADMPSFLHLASRAGIHEVPVRETDLVSSPAVAGWVKPVVLLPRDISQKIGRAMLDALTAHEFIHIRRHDGIMNLLQTVIEDLFFFNPATWWVSARIRAEREACCDDDAVAICGDSLLYARALSEAEQFRSTMPLIALNGSPLFQRVRRLTEMKNAESNRTSVVFVSLLAVSFTILIAASSISLAFMPPRETREASGQNNPEVLGNTARKGTAAQKPAKGNLIGGIPGGITGGKPGSSGKPAPPPPPSSKKKIAIVNPNDFIAGSEKAKSDAVQGVIVGGMTSMPNGPVAPPPQITVPGKDIAVKCIRKTTPVFPDQAVQSHAGGKVTLLLKIDAEGNVSDINAMKGETLFADAAVAAVKQWKYTPTFLNGQPIPILATVSIIFTFDKDGKPKVIY